MLVGKDHCWWERIMLVAEDHVVGEGSCWWERIMLVVEDGKFSRKTILAYEKPVFCTEWVPICPFATKIAANYMSARRRPDFMGVLGSENSSMSR